MMSEEEGGRSSRGSDFTIDHILNRAGRNRSCGGNSGGSGGGERMLGVAALPWLQCTRYCPPRIPSKCAQNSSVQKNKTRPEISV